MTKKTLITYASKAGSTLEIANHMGEMLIGKGVEVDVMPVDQVTDITSYQSVILGSAIRVGKVLPDALKFVEKNQVALKQKPFGVFVVCMTLNDDTPENRKIVSDYLNPIRALVMPSSEGLFAGVMDLKKLNLLEKILIKAMKVPEGDFRNWDQIDAWNGNLFLN